MVDSALIDQIINNINEVYRNDVRDYRARNVNAKHVTNYFWASYHRNQKIVKYLSNCKKNIKVLDIGIGYGFYDILLKEQYDLNVTGMEVAENIDAYCLLPKKYGIRIISGQLSETVSSVADSSFDVVIFSEVIEHLRISPLDALQEIYRILKPGGTFLLTTPNIARFTNILRLVAGYNIIEAFPDDGTGLDHITDRMTHIREYTMNELKELMLRTGYKVDNMQYSLSDDKCPRGQIANRIQKLRKLILLPMLTVFPRFRSLLFITGQKINQEIAGSG